MTTAQAQGAGPAAASATRSPNAKPKRSRAAQMRRVQWAIGLTLTAIIGALHLLGHTEYLERPLEDLHMRMWRLAAPTPTDKVVVAAIDDRGAETIGRWPWPRRYLAEAIDEISAAGASVIALDITLDTPQVPEHPEGVEDPIDNDAILAEAIRAHGRVVLATSFMYARIDELRLYDVATARTAEFIDVLDAIATDPAISDGALLSRLLPHALPRGPEMDDLMQKAERARTLIRYGGASSRHVPEPRRDWIRSIAPRPPESAFADAAKMLASVSFAGGDSDGGVRRIPLWTQVQDRLYPTLGLAAIAVHWGVGPDDIRIEGDSVYVPRPDGARVRLRTHRAVLKDISDVGARDGMMYVVWPRVGWSAPDRELRGWRWQFAREVRRDDAATFEPGEVSLARIIESSRLLGRVRDNIRDLHRGLRAADAALGGMPFDMDEYAQRSAALLALTPHDEGWTPALEALREPCAAAVEHARWLLESFEGEEELSEDDAALRAVCEQVIGVVPIAIREIERGGENLVEWRRQLRERMNGAVCFVGWTSTGAAADFVPTAISPRTPGVLVHAALVSSILTPHMAITRTPLLDLPALLLLGALGALIGVRLPGFIGLPALALTMLTWLAINHLLFWDRAGMLVATAAPFLAATLSWLGVTLHQLLVEERSRRRTEARFRSYVSPDVVDILVNNPGLDSMAPQKRELTVMFTDIAGFTTLSERLGTERTSAVLSAYLGRMTDILQANRATLDKYLGDGIMSFWGAPIEDAEHARHAVDAALAMFDALDEMNSRGDFGDAGALVTRIGVATGEVNVGDFGNPPHKSAYTVIGDAVNLAARLESANKQLGTRCLLQRRTLDLAGTGVRTRPIGRLRLVGKNEWVEVHELIGPRTPKGDRTDEWVRLTTSTVNAFWSGDLDACERGLGMLEQQFDERKLVEIYRQATGALRDAGGPATDFDGAITLVEK